MGGGMSVYISGSGFVDTGAVSFGANRGTNLTATEHVISLYSPPGNGQVHITVSAPGGNVTSSALFTYSTAPPPSNPPPEVDALAPNQATSKGGGFVAIYGSGFSSRVSDVQFCGAS